jgi:hypothetical protein
MRKLLALALLFTGFATVTPAQQRGAAAPAVHAPVMHAMPPATVSGGHVAPMHVPSSPRTGTPPRPVAPGNPVGTHRSTNHNGNFPQPYHSWNNAANTIRRNYCSGQPLNNYAGNPVPGFGFDFVHFFAVHPNWNTCSQGFNNGQISWLGGGYGYGMPYPYYSQPAQNDNQENASNDQQQDSNRQAAAQESYSSRQSSYTYSPAEPIAEFIFVKRDGSTFNAVAFTLLKDKIRYVTKDGVRRTVPLDSLDLEATQKSNEERGTAIEFPGLSHAA